jgi:biopolymer transport protein ExbD
MRLPPPQRRPFGINMTPMIDVVFLLIIFFLLSSHLVRQETQLELALPTAQSGEETVEPPNPRVTVNVMPDGILLLGSTPIDSRELEDQLRFERQRSGAELEVRIRGDRSVPYRSIEPILLAAARAGIWNVSIAVIREEDG